MAITCFNTRPSGWEGLVLPLTDQSILLGNIGTKAANNKQTVIAQHHPTKSRTCHLLIASPMANPMCHYTTHGNGSKYDMQLEKKN